MTALLLPQMDLIQCPHCEHTFEPTAAMRHAVEERLRGEIRGELDVRVKQAVDAAQRDADARLAAATRQADELRGEVTKVSTQAADHLRRARELEEQARTAELEFEQRLVDERARLAIQEDSRAKHRIELAVREVTLTKERELTTLRDDVTALRAREGEIEAQRRTLAEQRSALGAEVQRRVTEETERARLDAARDAQAQADKRVADERARQAAQQESDRRRLDEAAESELALRQQLRALEDLARAAKLDAERQLVEEQARVRAESDARAKEQLETERSRARLAEEEHKRQNEQLRQKLDELQARVQQRSADTIGEAQEVRLEETLRDAFRGDALEPVARGVRGADLLQRIHDGSGRQVGTILWESKRTRAWSNDWLPKLRDEQRAQGCDHAVLVTQTLPTEIERFGLVDGTWVTDWACAIPLAFALRRASLELDKERRHNEGRADKIALVYEYVCGSSFRQAVEGVVEVLAELDDQLAKERRAVQASWKRREAQHRRAMGCIASAYGGLQGLAGRAVEDLAALAAEPPIARLGAPAREDHARTDGRDGASDAQSAQGEEAVGDELTNLLYELVPLDGSAIGNGRLFDLWSARAASELGLDVDDATYARCKGALVTRGAVSKGRGRGGSVARRK